LRQADTPAARSLKNVELVPQGENLELQRCSRAHRHSHRLKERHQERQHRQEAYRRTTVSAIAAIGTEFSVGTGCDGKINGESKYDTFGGDTCLSTRRADDQAKSFSGGGHPLVVRDDPREVVAKQLGGRQMNGIETPQHTVIQHSRHVEQLLIQLNQIEPAE